MPEEIQVAKEEAQVTAPVDTTTTENVQDTPTAEVDKTEGVQEPVKTEPAEEPWHKDPRFKKFLDEKKNIDERIKAFDGLEQDPDFAAFLAYKRQKDSIAQQAKEPAVDYSKMTAEEYASHIENKAKEAARLEYQNLAESNKKGDRVTREAIEFAEGVGVDKATFQKDYGPMILKYYEDVGKKIGMDKLDAFVETVPPKEVFKNFFFDKAGEIGVKKYKEEIEKAKGAAFESSTRPKEEALPADSKSRFDTLWAKAYGSAHEVPQGSFGKQRG